MQLARLPFSSSATEPEPTSALESLRVLVSGVSREVEEEALKVLFRAGYAPVIERAADLPILARALVAPPDVIFVDRCEGEGSAFEAVAALTEVGLDTPVLWLADRLDEAGMLDALRLGVADCVRRDRLDRLGLAVARALERGRLRAEQAEARRALQDSEARLRLVLDSLPTAAYTCDAAGLLTYYNPEAARVWGCTPELGDPATRHCGAYRLWSPAGEPVAREECSVAVALRENRSQLGREIIVERPDGTRRRVLSNVNPLRDAAARVVGAVNVLVDVTEARELREQFLRVQRLEGLGMLAAGIAHDLNNILAPLLMASPLLRLHVHDPGDLRILQTIERNARRGVSLVRQILDFAHGSSGTTTLLQVRHVLRDMAAVIEESFPRDIVLDNAIEHDLWAVRANPTQLHQVLLNLCVNARDAMNGAGTLRLAARNQPSDMRRGSGEVAPRPGDRVVLEVGDTGTGIVPEVLARMWEPFFTTKSAGKGTGLGLSTVRGIVEAHGGTVEVDTEPGRGTTFRVFLPAATDAPAPGA